MTIFPESFLTYPPRDGFEPARRALSDVKSSEEVRIAAIDVLMDSHDWHDIALVREARMRLFALPGAELRTADGHVDLGPREDSTPDFVPDLTLGDAAALIVVASCLITIGAVIGLVLARSGVL